MESRHLTAVTGIALTAIAAAGLGYSATANADPGFRHANSYSTSNYVRRHSRNVQYDYAQVLSAEPIIRYVTVSTPVRECWQDTEYVEVDSGYRGTGSSALVGAIIGGVVGHQFGSGRGNDVATVAGSLIGAAIGSDQARKANRRRYRNEVYSRPVERCSTITQQHREERIEGYHVVYRYKERQYATKMSYDPGSELRIRVDIRPADRARRY